MDAIMFGISGSQSSPFYPPPSSSPVTSDQVIRSLAMPSSNGLSPGSSYNSHGPLTPTQVNTPYHVPIATGMYPMNSGNHYKVTPGHANYYARVPQQEYMGSINPAYNKNTLIENKQVAPMYGFPPPLSSPYSYPQNGQYAPRAAGVVGVAGRVPIMMGDIKLMKNPKRVLQQQQLTANKDRTIYVSEIDHNVTEEDLARLFSRCGDVVDCRLCGDAHSRMRFAFIEFSHESWRTAVPESLKLNSTVMCGVPIRVLRSKTAIVPVKRDLLPKSADEMERCQRTIYVSNIDKRLTEVDVRSFFETLSVDHKQAADGKISKVRMLGDGNHNTSIAFIEFCTAESAVAALNNCQGALMGCLPLRVSPSKTPVRSLEEDRALREAQRNIRY